MNASTSTSDVTRATYVLGIHRWLAASFGLLTVFGTEWLTEQVATDALDAEAIIEKYLPYPTLVVHKSWGLSVLAIAALVHFTLSFHPFERVAVCKCLSIMFAIETAIFARLAVNPTLVGSDSSTHGGVEFASLFTILSGAYAWASMEKMPQQSTQPPPPAQNKQTILSTVIKVHAPLAFAFGLLSIFQPQGFYDYPLAVLPLDPESLGTSTPPELFAIQCWGTFIFGIGMLCTQVSSFEMKSQQRFGMAMLFYFVSLTVLYLMEWPELNFVYRWGSVPIFGSMSVLYVIGLALLPHPLPSSSTKKTQ